MEAGKTQLLTAQVARVGQHRYQEEALSYARPMVEKAEMGPAEPVEDMADPGEGAEDIMTWNQDQS